MVCSFTWPRAVGLADRLVLSQESVVDEISVARLPQSACPNHRPDMRSLFQTLRRMPPRLWLRSRAVVGATAVATAAAAATALAEDGTACDTVAAAATATEEPGGISATRRKRVVIIGSGVVGLASAYCIECASQGEIDVQIVDRSSVPAAGASFQNGGVINVEAIVPLSTYMSFPQTFKDALWSELTGCPVNTTVSIRALTEPGLLRWVYHFHRNASEEAVQRNATTMKRLGELTKSLFDLAAADLHLTPASHNYARTPGLVLSTVDDPEETVRAKRTRWDPVLPKQYITGERLTSVLQGSGLQGSVEQHNLGAVEPNNLTVNTHALCLTLKERLEERGVSFTAGSVASIRTIGDRVTGVALTDGRTIEADAVVVAANFGSSQLLSDVGVSLPLAPIKAYSLHIPNAALAQRLRFATLVHTPTVHALITPYRDEPAGCRVTGIRDIDQCDEPHAARVQALMDVARHYVGDWADEKDVHVWAGVMAVSPDDFPIVGPTQRYPNLYINTGHGFRGTNWSLASAHLLVRSMETCMHAPRINPAGELQGGEAAAGGAVAMPVARTCDDQLPLVELVSPKRFGL